MVSFKMQICLGIAVSQSLTEGEQSIAKSSQTVDVVDTFMMIMKVD